MAYRIINKKVLNPQIFLMEIEAPLIAKKAEPGQFIILRIDEFGERVPFTISDFDRENGTITIIVQIVGKTTKDLALLEEGDEILDFAGPLGMPTELEGLSKVAVIGGGLGTAIAYPQAKKLHKTGAEVHTVAGFRDESFIILEDELKAVSDKLIITTDDGSLGEKGFVTYGTTTDTDDAVVVTYPYILGKYVKAIPKVGTFFNFLKTTQGYITCILIPFLILIGWQALGCVQLFRQRIDRLQHQHLP